MRAISIQNPLKTSLVILSLSFSMFLGACSTNPATGERQFASFMSPEKEKQVGAQEHEKILKQFGGIYKNKAVTDYVQAVGQKVAQNTERPDVQYKFFVLDTPEANAFALPGGYVYITRGILALASDESELAAVLGHEVGHITGRHSAERYSHSIVTGLGATLLGAAVNSPDAARMVGVGASLYLNSYSRSQESEADMLGVRYLSRSGYDTTGMTRFLKTLGAYTQLDARANDKGSSQTPVYFSTHPLNADRVAKTIAEAAKYTGGSATARNKNDYLKKIMGLPWGSSAAQGYVRGNEFIHPELGFKFTAPPFAKIVNRPSEVVISAKNQESQGVAVLDMATSKQPLSAAAYIQYEWMNEEPLQLVEPIKINGLNAATAVFPGHVNGRAAQIRLVAIQWAQDKFFRFQIAMPTNISATDNNAYKSMTYSFQRINKENLGRGDAISLVHARSGDTVGSLAQLQNKVFDKYSSEYFKVLNGLIDPRDNIRVGELYKVIKRD
jgi:predicted Zn-dependent protease